MQARSHSGSWRDWVMFAAAYGLIMGMIFFAYPPTSAQHQAAATTSATVR
ncbi:hypothetical protein DFO45_3628 [Azorhizobium sp. AG788]|nr:hypothetical protein [Azorhizobium sp. AG788]TDT92866.1 hypothetical protein DFO45_3628 [Azorhizobium sp. AG788]